MRKDGASVRRVVGVLVCKVVQKGTQHREKEKEELKQLEHQAK